MKKQDKKNLLLVAFFVLLVIAIIIALIIEILPKNIINEKRSEEINLENYVEDKVIPQGIYVFTQNYNGEIDRNDFYVKLNLISLYILDLYNDLQKKEITEYYNKNEDEILKNLGIEDLKEFDEIANIIKNANLTKTKFSHCAIEKNSFLKDTFYTSFNLDFNYENGEVIKFKIKLLNKEIGNKPIVIVGIP